MNVALFSENATKAELCLFASADLLYVMKPVEHSLVLFRLEGGEERRSS